MISRSPWRFIFSGFKTFQDKLDESAHKVLTDYQAAAVTLLALLSAAPGDIGFGDLHYLRIGMEFIWNLLGKPTNRIYIALNGKIVFLPLPLFDVYAELIEASPSEIRGSLVSTNVLMITAGQFLSYLVNLAFTELFSSVRQLAAELLELFQEHGDGCSEYQVCQQLFSLIGKMKQLMCFLRSIYDLAHLEDEVDFVTAQSEQDHQKRNNVKFWLRVLVIFFFLPKIRRLEPATS
ncbi:hypothetical protein Ahy_B02g057830 isoform A [Arachis hypogaea]|nr:hypothetical protein Ahy_B02g057830 isoform A [Arachis hypogaea]